MAKMKAHRIFYEKPETGKITKRSIATIYPASAKSVKLVLAASDTDPDGRSNWVWCRFQNGDLMLGVFPQGDTYFSCEKDAQAPEGV